MNQYGLFRLLLYLLLLALSAQIVIETSSVSAEQSELTTAAPLIVAKDEFGVAVVDGQIYAIGGMTGPLATPLSDNEVFDPVLNHWEQLPPLPSARRAVRAAAIDQTIYVVGGSDGEIVSTVDMFDTVSKTWSVGTPLPVSLLATGLITIDDSMFAIGGLSENGIISDAVYEYRTTTHTWVTRSSMPTPRSHLTVVSIDGLIYALGGSRFSGPQTAVEIYDPKVDKWTIAEPLPEAMMNFGAVAIRDQIHVLLHDLHFIYSVDTNSWNSSRPMMIPRHGFGIAAIENRIFIIGGCHEDLFDTRETEVLYIAPMNTPQGSGFLIIFGAIVSIFVLVAAGRLGRRMPRGAA